jgi:hypothetical protein
VLDEAGDAVAAQVVQGGPQAEGPGAGTGQLDRGMGQPGQRVRFTGGEVGSLVGEGRVQVLGFRDEQRPASHRHAEGFVRVHGQ